MKRGRPVASEGAGIDPAADAAAVEAFGRSALAFVSRHASVAPP